MATIRSYTTLEQSRKLVKILSLESADMHYVKVYFEGKQSDWFVKLGKPIKSDDIIPCWSLAALLSVLPIITKGKENANPFIAKTPDNKYYVVYATLTKEVDSSNIYDNSIDACYELILKLNELNLL